jgi:glycosyltransferase involved in cell wall biosynthesis
MNSRLLTSAAPLRIALIDDVMPSAALHDADHHLIDKLAWAMAHQGHMVDIYRGRGPGEPVWEDVHEQVRIHRIDNTAPWPLDDQPRLGQAVQAFAAGMRRMVMEVFPCDVIHAWGLHAGLVGLRLSRGVAVPFTWTMPSPVSGESPQQIAQLLVARAQALVAFNVAQRDALLDIPGARRADVHLVPGGVDTQLFRPRNKACARRELGLPDDAFVVLMAGPVTPTCRALIAELPAHVLTLQDASQGKGDEAGGRVKLVGDCCAAADVLLVQGDQQAALDIDPKEAMACGLPVLALAQRSGDEVARVVEDGVTGYVLQTPHMDVAMDHLRHLRDQPHWRSAMGMAGILRARTFFTWTKAADQMLDIYSECAQASQLSQVGQICRSLTLIQSPGRCAPMLVPVQ